MQLKNQSAISVIHGFFYENGSFIIRCLPMLQTQQVTLDKAKPRHIIVVIQTEMRRSKDIQTMESVLQAEHPSYETHTQKKIRDSQCYMCRYNLIG